MEETKTKKKKFKKPIFKKVPLKVEEAVLAACKSDTIMGNGPGGSMNLCVTKLGMGQTAACSTYAS